VLIKALIWWLVSSLVVAGACAGAATSQAAMEISPVEKVWSGHSVKFALAVSDTTIFAAYYDARRRLTVASRPRQSPQWTYQKLEVVTGWDSHNYIAMAIDAAGHLHVTGNMHNDPLVYFQSRAAGDIRSLERIEVLVNAARERRMTYPVFIHHRGRLILKYRDGGSGNGNEIYDEYDPVSNRWRALLDTPLVDGEGQRNAYFVGPRVGPDGRFHIAWVWRETPDAETNHDLSYARSPDLVHWETSDGKPLVLPITLKSCEIVDPVPVEAGMINNNTVVGFDSQGRAMITYHKFDAQGFTQLFVARREASWVVRQISDWKDFRWDFRGRGSLDSRLFVSGAEPAGRQRLRVAVIRDDKPVDFLLDERTLERVSELPGDSLAARLSARIRTPAGMQLNTVEDAGGSGIALAWATRPPQRDLPSDQVPAPTELNLIMLR
jgi:hypothetical protein